MTSLRDFPIDINATAHLSIRRGISSLGRKIMQSDTRLGIAFWGLKLGLGGSAFLAGADKFTNLLVNWEKYMAPEARHQLPVSRKNFMRALGITEMLVSTGILTNQTRLARYTSSARLAAIDH